MREFLDGNTAMARGALAAGCDFFAGYPITPATSILLTMMRDLPRMGGIAIQGEDAEVMEALALETSDIVGRPLMEMSLPKGVLVLTILRGENVIIPTGQSVVAPNDRIIIFARREAIPKIEKILAVKLEYF